ncbi:GF14E [Symbiodinium sp. KB8]|nr:GF14E [Symbiodinium sp. KB8]
MATEVERLVYKAKLAEEAERFEDMVGFVTALAKQKTLSVEERNLLSVAFKNVVGSKRASWRILSGIEAKERETGDPARADRVGGLRGVVEEELAGVCTALLDLIDGTLLPKDATPEGIAFYNKMAGDYNRYMAEFATGPQRESAAGSAAARYDAARRAAEGLPATDPIRLGLALNHSVFLLEIMGRHTEACEVAKAAFDAGVTHVSSLSGADYRDATLILQLMRDNLALWTEEGAEAGAGAGVGAA